MLTLHDAKSMAKALETALHGKNVVVSHGECLDMVARQFGLKDWNVLAAQAKRQAALERRCAAELKAWSFLAEHRLEYDHGADDEACAPGQQAALIRFRPTAAPSRYPYISQAFGCYMQTVSAKPFLGKRLEIKAEMRCAGVTHGATIWARVDGKPGHTLGFDNLKGGPDGWLIGDMSWTTRRIVLDVSSEALTLNFGFFLKGAGSLWARAFSIEIADAAAEPTAPAIGWQGRNAVLTGPENLNFADVVRATVA